MTKLVKFCQLYPSDSHIRPLMENTVIVSRSTALHLHFFYLLLRGTL